VAMRVSMAIAGRGGGARSVPLVRRRVRVSSSIEATGASHPRISTKRSRDEPPPARRAQRFSHEQIRAAPGRGRQ